MSPSELRDILHHSFQIEDWKRILGEIFGHHIEYFTRPFMLFPGENTVKQGSQIAHISLEDGKNIAVFDVEVNENIQLTRNRKGLRDIAFHYIDQNIIHGALVFFHSSSEQEYRFTFIARHSLIGEEGDINIYETAPKRYTYLLGGNETCVTPCLQISSLMSKAGVTIEDIFEAFSVEKISKEFFSKYKSHYNQFVNYLIQSPQNVTCNSNRNEKAIRDFVKKMMGRIVFLYFLQKKGWLGATDTEYRDGDKNFMNNLWENSAKDEIFYSLRLQELFFNGLNKQREKDNFQIPGGKICKVPFLNGGLFEKSHEIEIITFPPDLFQGLFDFLSEYNFTIDENNIDEFEIGIDPEMLGHIFENLLEDNRDKGAYYTPKEIVRFMTQESLIEYLYSKLKQDTHPQEILDIKACLQHFVRYKRGEELPINPINTPTEELNFYKEQSKFLTRYGERLNRYLDEVKICDPAIGSGAFPMGLLNEIFQCKLVLNKTLSTQERVNIKKHIIENSIYGVDVEMGAVDIARLRFWLSLVIDMEKPEALPNFDYKIVAGDSLVSKFEGEPVDINWGLRSAKTGKMIASEMRNLLAELVKKQQEYFSSHDKERLAQSIRNLKLDILERQIRYNQKIQLESCDTQTSLWDTSKGKIKIQQMGKNYGLLLTKIQKLKENPKREFNFFDWKLNFPEILNPDVTERAPGFDIVIGNPPYLRVQGIRQADPEYADLLVKKFSAATGSFDLYTVFTQKAFELIRPTGVLNFIMPVKWTNAAFGKGLREQVSEAKTVSRIISFSSYQVFNASTYTALQWFKHDTEHVEYIELNRDLKTNTELQHYLYGLKSDDFCNISWNKLSASPWTLTNSQSGSILDILEQHPRKLKDIFDKVFVGLQTSKDSVYFLHECRYESNYVYGKSLELGEIIKIEQALTKPLLKGDDVHRYDTISSDKVVIFPYQLVTVNRKVNAILYNEKELEQSFPYGYEYLKRCEQVLRNRENGKLSNDKQWYKYIYPKNLTSFEIEKLVAPEISLGGNFAYDKDGKFYGTTKIYGYIKRNEVKESYKFFLAILNSKILWYYLQNTGYVLRGGYFTFKTNYLNPFPIPTVKESSYTQPFEFLVDAVILLKAEQNNDSKKSVMVYYFEQIIDGLVCELYFPELMQEKEIDIWKYIHEDISLYSTPITFNDIEKLYKIWNHPDHPVKNRLKLFSVRSSDILKPILESK